MGVHITRLFKVLMLWYPWGDTGKQAVKVGIKEVVRISG
jgi:hypothetical protein